MLRAFLAGRGSLVRRLHATPVNISSFIRCASESSPVLFERCARINLHSARTWVEKVAPSLQTFLELEQHLMISLKFVVPYGDPKWPQEAWGYPLGMHCRNLRVLKQQRKTLPFFAIDDLETLNFPWDLRQCKWDVLVLPSLKRYYEIEGDSDVPSVFVVPTGDDNWPRLLWGFKLGQTVTSMRYADAYRAQRERSYDELEEINFSTRSWRARMWETKILPALVAFKQEFGHCNVHFHFIVPEDEKWPKATRGLRLGPTVANMRSRDNYDDLVKRDKDKLKEIGFCWNPEDERWTNKIMPALETYQQVYGSGWISAGFVVPNEEPWPEESRGMKLGSIFMKVRHTGAYSSYVERDKKRLDALGISFNAHYDATVADP
ncbi:hypothetical protein PHMEG_00014635 [Phytophthora megakarya]|uniref:Helicase-associated domain-containing protein n=1 Tax=Phytophthora megakarya TaxID=4795 RepID=A0A225W4V7_9STRA|nr:hypothetical protein PHMEG_00014635 [Phytophthora megakarya]